ncbi:MAG: FAD-dependent oxidoreductase [Thermoleophilia bacterium]|nr:FAD-dependent oxidoreductase [Thermoleophilia bacterium]
MTGLGAGVLDKLWLAFDEVFWEPDAEMFQWIDPDRPGLWAEWINGNHYLGKPLLMGLNGGSQAADLSAWSDEEVLRSGMSALEAMYNQAA